MYKNIWQVYLPLPKDALKAFSQKKFGNIYLNGNNITHYYS